MSGFAFLVGYVFQRIVVLFLEFCRSLGRSLQQPQQSSHDDWTSRILCKPTMFAVC